MEFTTSSAQETQQKGEEFAHQLKGGDIVCLYGNLGGGKTTFVQGLAKGLGIKRRIISPTFIILRSYKLKDKRSNLKTTAQSANFFYHIDLYRIEAQNDIELLGIEEILKDSKNIIVIEWAEKMGNLLPKEHWDIKFEYIDEEKRKINIKKLI